MVTLLQILKVNSDPVSKCDTVQNWAVSDTLEVMLPPSSGSK
jgi:hypothetical protein